MEAAKKQNLTPEETKNKCADEVKIFTEDISKLETRIQSLESERAAPAKEKEIKFAEANSVVLKNQSKGVPLEYDHWLAENQQLRDQLRSIDESVSHSNGKKNM
ncbi:B-cell receptor-associated protein 31-like protein [Tanacetum coccineum]